MMERMNRILLRRKALHRISVLLLVMLMIVNCAACGRKNDRTNESSQDSEYIFLVTDDSPVCNMIISDELFKEITENDDYSFLLDLMNDYFNVIINKEIEPCTTYIRAVTEKIDSEIRLEEVYNVSNKISVIVQIAEAGLTMLNSDVDGSMSEMTVNTEESTTPAEENPERSELFSLLMDSVKSAANKGSVCSVRAIKEEFRRKTAEIYDTKPDTSASLKYGDYVIQTDNDGISIICGSLESNIDALNYFLTEYVQMGSSSEGNYLINVPDSAVHVGHYLNIRIADRPLKDYSIIYYCDKTYYDSRENAKYLKSYFQKNCGIDVFTKDSDSSREIEHKIVIGKSRLDKSLEFYDQKYDLMDYRIIQDNGNLYIMGGSDWAIRYAINYLIDTFFSKEIPVPSGYSQEGNIYGEQIFDRYENSDLRIMSNNVWDCAYNSWYSLGENSYNINRFTQMAKVYLAYMPDVLSLQELNMRIAYSNAMLREINATGGNYRYVDRYSSGYEVGCSERNCTPIVYNSDTVTLLAAGDQQYPRGGNNSNTKSFTWGYFEKKGTDFRFLVFSTHLWWKRDVVMPGSSDLRIQQMTILDEKANELIETYQCPCFVLGDFNCKSTSREFMTLESLGFTDCHSIAEEYVSNESGRYACNVSTFCYKHSAGTYKKNSIDHIMVKNLKKASVLSYDYALPNFYGKLSDHAPVYIDVKIR